MFPHIPAGNYLLINLTDYLMNKKQFKGRFLLAFQKSVLLYLFSLIISFVTKQKAI